MQIDIKNMDITDKITILLEIVIGCVLIGIGIILKQILVVCFGLLLWIFVIDLLIIESKNTTIKLFTLLCDVQQEMLAEKCGCSRAEVDRICTEKLRERSEGK